MDQPIGSPDWLSSARRQLEEELNVAQRSQEEQEQQLECCGETLQLLVDTIKTILSNHNRQLGDVKHLLRAMAKVSPTHTHCKHRGRCGSGPVDTRVGSFSPTGRGGRTGRRRGRDV